MTAALSGHRLFSALLLTVWCGDWNTEGEKGTGMGGSTESGGDRAVSWTQTHPQSVLLEGAPDWEEAELRGRKTAEVRAEHGEQG